MELTGGGDDPESAGRYFVCQLRHPRITVGSKLRGINVVERQERGSIRTKDCLLPRSARWSECLSDCLSDCVNIGELGHIEIKSGQIVMVKQDTAGSNSMIQQRRFAALRWGNDNGRVTFVDGIHQ
jgi:hypothetical protein